MAGPNIVVGGAVFADVLISQTLTDYISIVPRPGLEERSPIDSAVYRVARLFNALKTCIGELDAYYASLHDMPSGGVLPPVGSTLALTTGASSTRASSTRASSKASSTRASSAGRTHISDRSAGPQAPPANPVPVRIWPHFQSYTVDNTTYQLSYLHPLSNDYMKTVYQATATAKGEPPLKVVVKFAHKYCPEAHGLLAAASLAPKLHFCERVPSVAMWVVVMDYVEGIEVNDKVTDPQHVVSLRNALTMLHEKGFVFGDLRCPNVLVKDNGVVLIDFDWCGKEGVARYPSDINVSEATWDSDVKRGGLIKKVHDEFHFNKLTKQKL